MGQAEALADRMLEISGTIQAAVAGFSDEQWRAVTAEESWTVCQAAAHIADAYQLIAPRVQALATGGSLAPMTTEGLNERNRQHAEEWAKASRDDVIALLRTNSAAAAEMIRGLPDEQLDRERIVREGMPPRSARMLIEGAMINHALGHFSHIQTAAG